MNRGKAIDFEQCMKCTICNDYCPVVKVNPIFPGPKLAGPDGARFRLISQDFYDENLKLCLNCKRCETSCPSDVKISELITEARLKYGKQEKVLRNTILSQTDLMGTIGSTFAPVANTVAGMMFHGGPRYSFKTFEAWFKKEAAPSQDSFEQFVNYFHGCYVNYNYPKLGKDLVKVMNALGIGVKLFEKEKCCGIALISNGFVKKARKQAESNLELIAGVSKNGSKVIMTSSTCALTIRNEYPELLGLDNSECKENIETAAKFIYEFIEKNSPELKFKNQNGRRIVYHTPCHMAKLGWSIYSIELLKMIPGLEVKVIEQQCCGVAGTYGFKSENKKTSFLVGEPLFLNLRELSPDTVATDCETCKWQIEMNTGLKVENPISIFADALDII